MHNINNWVNSLLVVCSEVIDWKILLEVIEQEESLSELLYKYTYDVIHKVSRSFCCFYRIQMLTLNGMMYCVLKVFYLRKKRLKLQSKI